MRFMCGRKNRAVVVGALTVGLLGAGAGAALAADYNGHSAIPVPIGGAGTAPNTLYGQGNEQIASGIWRLVQQSDGNLVFKTTSGRVCWASGTNNHPNVVAAYQWDGNFVVYDHLGGKALWASNTKGDDATGTTVSITNGYFYVGHKYMASCT